MVDEKEKAEEKPPEKDSKNKEENTEEQMIPENVEPPKHRQALEMMGLPQTFLQEAGIDEQFFDSLPQDLQVEQLITFVREQESMRPFD